MKPSDSKYSEFFTELTLGLLESFYPFTTEELVKYQNVLNLYADRLLKNAKISWDADLVESLKDLLDFKILYRAKNLVIDYDFLKRFEEYFDFTALGYFNNVVYSEEILSDFDSKLDWTTSVINREGFTTIENIRKYKDKIDWQKLSSFLRYPIDEAFLEEFDEYVNWDKLSYNPNIKLDIKLLEKYQSKFNFRHLSWNSAAAPLILKYPKSSRWDWNFALRNEGIAINEENVDIMVKYHAKQMQSLPFLKNRPFEFALRVARSNVVSKLVQFRRNGIDYLFDEKFKENYIWHFISDSYSMLPEDFVLDNISNFKSFGSEFINKNGKYFTTELIQKNIEKFDLKKWQFYKLNITMDIVNENIHNINFLWLSSNESIDWNPDFIYKNKDRLNFNRLCENRKIYESLLGNWTKEEILSFLDSQN